MYFQLQLVQTMRWWRLYSLSFTLLCWRHMLWKCAHIFLYCTSKYLHGCIQFSASAAIFANTFLQIVKIIVWIVAFFVINIISQSSELSCLGLSLRNVWITLFLQNQLFWTHAANLCYDSTESFDWRKEGPVHFL